MRSPAVALFTRWLLLIGRLEASGALAPVEAEQLRDEASWAFVYLDRPEPPDLGPASVRIS